ncbi:MAG: 50S ribosomal protein L30 [Ignavibacteria bacterium]|nr:50S ribosomal protein L30 [Ignavibacteria bacterium]MBI3766224.1 50S ribosomal protein L30 [Ignavibacteriales bacterium]
MAHMTSQIKITQIVSQLDCLEKQKRTIKALGLGRPNYSVIKNDTPQIRGMINRVKHLVKVEEVK